MEMESSSFLLEDEELHCAREFVYASGLAELRVSLNAYVGSAHFIESPRYITVPAAQYRDHHTVLFVSKSCIGPFWC